MPEIENLHDIPEDCLELDDSSGFQEEDIALHTASRDSFELLAEIQSVHSLRKHSTL